MASLSSAKSLGGVGSILALIPGISLVGWILVLVAIKDISDVTQDKSIFDDALLAVITAIIGAVGIVLGLFLGGFAGLFTFGAIAYGPLGFFGAIAVLAVTWAVLIVSSIFLKRAYDKIAQRLQVHSFATAGLLYLIGAITIIAVVGILILFIALIFQIVAYFSIQDQAQPTTYYGYQPPQPPGTVPSPQLSTVAPPQAPAATASPAPPQAQTAQPSPLAFKFCHHCGAKLAYDAVFCSNCGTKQ